MMTDMRSAQFGLARDLLVAASGDTAFRDVYLFRAREIVTGVFPEERYREVAEAEARILTLLRRARDAMVREDWEAAKSASDKAVGLRHFIASEAATVDALGPLYSAPPVVCDPFSSSLPRRNENPASAASLRENVLRSLAALEQADPAWSRLYSARRTAVATFPLRLDDTTPCELAVRSDRALEADALRAAERGNVEQLQSLLAAVLESKKKGTGDSISPKRAAEGSAAVAPAILSEPFPAQSIERARVHGFEPVAIGRDLPAASEAIEKFLARHASSASVYRTESLAMREGVTCLRAAFESFDAPAGVSDVLAETVSLFAWQIYIGSGGLRYLPVAALREHVLLETFAEGEEPGSAILDALELEGRRALSRNQIEQAFVRHGASVIEGMFGLDPFSFRIVCVPPDVYVRAGTAHAWGRRREWTHLDGYRVLSGGRMLALVGGNSDFGGLGDLCGIGVADQRQNVTLRMAVVRRERLSTRFV